MPVLHLCPPQAVGLQWSGYAVVQVSTQGPELTVRCLCAVLHGRDVTDRVDGVELHPDCFGASAPFRQQVSDTVYRLLSPCQWGD